MRATKRHLGGPETGLMCMCLHPLHTLSQTGSRIPNDQVLLNWLKDRENLNFLSFLTYSSTPTGIREEVWQVPDDEG